MKPPYYGLGDMINMIDQPYRDACMAFWQDNQELFRQAPGSSHNHQAWTGGYQDHITEVMNLWLLFYGMFESTGRLARLPEHERFNRSDGLFALFWHDAEKPWTCVLENGQPVPMGNGRLRTKPEFADKAKRKKFSEGKLREYCARYGVELTPVLLNAFEYVEGVRDRDYSPFDRVMWPLAALCHACDMLSARLFYNFPFDENDPWGAKRAVACL